MYTRFTDRARRVMQLANDEAQRFSHEYIGTEHILLGLVCLGNGVGAEVLKILGVTVEKVRFETKKIVQRGYAEAMVIDVRPRTPRAMKVIELAIEEARDLQHN